MTVYRAVMDIGTNTCRLIVAEISEGRDMTLLRQIRVTRIGEGLGRGELHISRAAMDRTLAALTEYKTMIAGYPVDRVRLLGTQALREADNGLEFAAEVKKKTGFDLEIISGRQEAYLSYAGAVKGFADSAVIQPLVLDIGAGSTELFREEVSDCGERRVTGASAPVGCLRLLERSLDDAEILAALSAGWQEVESPRGTGVSGDGETDPEANEQKSPLVAVGGTATTLGAIHLMMKEYDPEALLGLRMTRSQVEAVLSLLVKLPPEERLALPGMMPGREDVMPWGLRILLCAMTYCRRGSVVICDRDLLYGALYDG